MTIDPIALMKTGSIAKSTYKSATTSDDSAKAATKAATGTTATSSGATGTSSSGSAKNASSSKVSASDFILSESLAALVEYGAKGLSGSALAAYNSQALATQNSQSVVSSLPKGDSLTSNLVGTSSNYALYRKMQAYAATNPSNTTAETSAKTDVTATSKASQ